MDIGRKLAELEARLGRVEGSPRLSHAALDNANIVVKDDTGTVRGRIGMQPDGTIGLIAVDGPAPGAPTAPVVTSTIGGLRVVWDGTLADGSTLPADFDHVAVHVSTTAAFTPSAATYVGTITKAGEGGMLPVLPLPYVAHYVRLTAVNTSGNAGDPSGETTATPIKVDGPDLEVGSVAAAAIQAGAVTAEKLEAVLQLVTRLVAGDPAGARVELNEDGLRVYNSSGELVIRFDAADGSGVFTGTITGSTVTGGLIQTATSGERITINEAGANKVVVYDSTGRAVGELSGFGLGLVGTGGALMMMDPNGTYPSLRMTNAAGTNEAIVNVSENNPGSADLGINSGLFAGSSFTDMKWRTFLGDDVFAAERVRNGTATTIGGRVLLHNDQATLGFMNTTNTSQNNTLFIRPGYAQLTKGRLEILAPASASTALHVNADAGQTGDLLRVLHGNAERMSVDPNGNTDIEGILSAGNIATGRVTITPVANTPTSVAVTGLSLKGTTIRIVATAATSVPGTSVTGVGVTNQSATGFTVWVTRTNTNTTFVDWIAYGS
ncbi:hypothetical protein [Streptomyces violaceus]|uniref:Fibronectin type-III domain-containing protein n=1 Tax=Streptomyces violaceus TaxID=1936 RepID=A0ABY9UMI7_STRVL|nr:hypothetical protein [Streptomyces janthinus]WND24122.1 hypothetical protein RI060_43155 [Streptomyces janthinus]GGS97047.1 hypothetical protein GCM10010270_81350 [Streptomyces janthinus]